MMKFLQILCPYCHSVINITHSHYVLLSIWNECARLLANCVIYYNAVILNELKEESDRRGDVERSQKLIRFSSAAWAHINFQGRYIFLENKNIYNIKEEIKKIFDMSLE